MFRIRLPTTNSWSIKKSFLNPKTRFNFNRLDFHSCLSKSFCFGLVTFVQLVVRRIMTIFKRCSLLVWRYVIGRFADNCLSEVAWSAFIKVVLCNSAFKYVCGLLNPVQQNSHQGTSKFNHNFTGWWSLLKTTKNDDVASFYGILMKTLVNNNTIRVQFVGQHHL